jgi:hypothetical protein
MMMSREESEKRRNGVETAALASMKGVGVSVSKKNEKKRIT